MGIDGFLKQVLEIKSLEVSKAKSNIPLNTIRREAENTKPAASFLTALQKSSPDDIGIIAEVKKASPSKGDIRPDLDPVLYAQTYTMAGARAISVLTESQYFKGSLKDLEAVCANTELPVLRKDFTIGSYQIYEAKKAGASSILLITTILSKDQLTDYILLARELGMEPLVEITSEKEFEIAYDCDAKVVDMNNRNLQTLETDLNVSKRIAAIIPEDIIPVEASGISCFADIDNGLSSNIFNFLVGESIVKAKDPELLIKELRNIK
ncbi:indole-3-glycerol phosphate synthase TrpC [Desulfobacula phenolica]|uniref:indole-3-glycerol-phosphate synthase n=1 Tax=Desulfobacula phenolica TaxID=90732 RepID=A0A1H2ET31_9BACT|nr:indole-3-glycerol phosphate synthase TrpC [Desulfobacula phenolica]SDT98231.1 indole-3-glycerol phosphate synthase [Desulfobacula phenolica]